ncbi:MAG: uroporphyrinogen decarboxylase family protein [Desulfobacterales bacterium]
MNRLSALAARHRRGNYPVFAPGPFLPLLLMHERGLQFNRILTRADDMAAAALLNFELGFETTVVPYDMNVEAEIIGYEVSYHEAVEGNPVYPTIGARWVKSTDDFDLPDDVAGAGRLPEILRAISLIKEKSSGGGAVGVFVPGPFTLAGQVLDPDRMFVMVLKDPDAMKAMLQKLTMLIIMVRDAYVRAGADYVVIEEGGATTISPKSFERLLLPELKKIFIEKKVPHLLFLTGKSDKYLDYMLEAGPDGIGVDQECDLDKVLKAVSEGFPLACLVGRYDLMATASVGEVRAAVRACLEKGVTMAAPPADIYPPARTENIRAFVDELRVCPKQF